MKRGYYVDLRRAGRIALLAGPFKDEPTARKYLQAATNAAHQLDAFAWFDAHGTMMLEREPPLPLGKLNDQLAIEPGDLLQEEEA